MTKTILITTLALFLGFTFGHAQEDVTAELQKSTLGKMASSVKLQLVDGKSFTESKMTKVPEYYILYFSASW
jgi:hypothetical protein